MFVISGLVFVIIRVMKKLYFVSSNKTKVLEAQHILGFPVTVASIDLPELQDSDIEVIVRQKALDAFEKIGEPVLVDDVGFYIDAWNGFPGPFIKFLTKASSNDTFLLEKLMVHETNRKAEVVSALGFHDGKNVHVFVGKVSGQVAKKARIPGVFMFDTLFIPDGQEKAYAEMSLEEKSAISHRRKSLEIFKKYLREHAIIFS